VDAEAISRGHAGTINTVMGPREYDEVLDSEGAAALLKISVATLLRETRAGRVPAAKVGRGYRYSRVALLALLDPRAPELPAG
jgi:excisionase family DNA binding protein